MDSHGARRALPGHNIALRRDVDEGRELDWVLKALEQDIERQLIDSGSNRVWLRPAPGIQLRDGEVNEGRARLFDAGVGVDISGERAW